MSRGGHGGIINLATEDEVRLWTRGDGDLVSSASDYRGQHRVYVGTCGQRTIERANAGYIFLRTCQLVN